MALEPAKKISLNQYTYSVRASQAVLQYGVGAMVDFPDQTLMTAAPEYWRDQVTEIHDERLEKALHVNYFGLPDKQGISYARFPEWYFCPKCRKFQPIKEWIREYEKKPGSSKIRSDDPYMVKHMQCPTCYQDLVVSRIVTVCDHGHIDDFPWIQWVHCRNAGGPLPICDHPALTFKTSTSPTEGLEGLTVSCRNCNAWATLRGAFAPGIFRELDQKYGAQYQFRCTGRHPWKNIREKCGRFPKVLQRGSSSVYFPVTTSSLVIPPYSSRITSLIENSSAFAEGKNALANSLKTLRKMFGNDSDMLKLTVQTSIDSCAESISLEIGVSEDNIRPILERKWNPTDTAEEEGLSNLRYRTEEYEALSGRVSIPGDEPGDFLREDTKIENYGIPCVKNISLIHKVREVQALIGFSRLNPVESEMNEKPSDRMVSIKEKDTDWYPAYEVRGEGIFVEFDDSAISDWQKQHPEVENRVSILNESYRKSFIGSSRPRKITAKFLLLHTISHALIKQLSFECGYGIASLKERLYCGEASDGCQMAGIFIYTASGDSEGTLGGLVRQGRSDTFPSLFRKAMESLMSCSNDPVCSLSTGQGRDSLNLAACYSCALIPETSCEEFNVFLDRGTVVGTFENKEMGFYYEQLYAGRPWESVVEKDESDIKEQDIPHIVPVDYGTDLSDVEYSEIWQDLREWAENTVESALLSELEDMAEKFAGKEKPYQNSQLCVTGNSECFSCDLYWSKSKAALFLADNEESYRFAKNGDIRCFYGNDPTVSAEMILSAVGEA